MSDLRTRIAAVLYERSVRRAGLDFKWATLTQDVVKKSWLDDADAVIRELGLRQEWAVADSDGDFVYVGSIKEKADCYTVQPGDHKQTRYVTEWENDE